MSSIEKYLDDLEKAVHAIDDFAAPEPPAPTGAEPKGIPYAEWRAAQLNMIFAEYGTAGLGRIAPATVEHGLSALRRAAVRRLTH